MAGDLIAGIGYIFSWSDGPDSLGLPDGSGDSGEVRGRLPSSQGPILVHDLQNSARCPPGHVLLDPLQHVQVLRVHLPTSGGL